MELICPECNHGHLIQDPVRGEYYCSNCGVIFNEYYLRHGEDYASEEMLESHAPLRQREGIAPDTEITPGNLDGKHHLISPERALEIHRLRKTERLTRFKSTTGRNLNHMLGFISAVSSRLGLTTPTRELAIHLYAESVRCRLNVGRNARAMTAASIYAACRYYSQPYSIEDIAESVLGGVGSIEGKKRVGKAYRLLLRHFNIRPAPPAPTDYLIRYSAELGLSRETERQALVLIERARTSGLTGGEPSSIAAAAIYLASKQCGKKVSQRQITRVSGVTDTTIRTRYRELNSLIFHT